MHGGEANKYKTKKSQQRCEAGETNLSKVVVGTEEFQDLGYVTEELVNDTETTKADREGTCCMHDSRYGPTDLDSQDSIDTGSDILDDVIVQYVAT